MKLTVDPTICQGYGLCADEAPELVELDDAGYATIIGDGDGHRRAAVRRREGRGDVPGQGSAPRLTPHRRAPSLGARPSA